MPRRKFIRETFGFAATQYVARAALMLRGFIAARLLGPQAYGAWGAIQLIMDYGAFTSAGTLQGLDQTVPAKLVEGDQEATRRVKRAALANIVFTTLLFTLGCLFWVSQGSSRVLEAWGFDGLALALGCVWAVNLSVYKLSLLRSHDRMNSVSHWFIVQSLVGSVLGLALVPAWGAWGLLVGWFTGSVLALLVIVWQARDIALHLPRFSWESIQLVRVGFPMFVHAAGGLALRSIDRIIVLRYLGTESMGHYSVAVMVLMLLLYLPDSIAYVLYPQLIKRFSQEGGEPASIRMLVQRVLQVMAVLIPLLSGIAYLWGREAIAFALPRFLPGAGAVRILAFGAFGLAMSNLASLVLMTVGRRMWLVPAAIASTALGVALDILAVRLGYGLSGVAAATVFTFVLSGTVMMSMSLIATGVPARVIPTSLLRMLLPLPLAIALAWACDRTMPWSGTEAPLLRLVRAGLGTLAFSVVYLVLASSLARGLGLQALLAEVDLPVLTPILRRLGWIGTEGRKRG